MGFACPCVRLVRAMMSAGLEIVRLELSSAEVRGEASRGGDARAACRMLAIALVLEGASRTEAAQSCGMDRQTLRDWVHRYNQDGIAGLSNLPAPGRPAALTPEQRAELKAIVLAGPDRHATAWCAGAAVTCAGSSPSGSRSRCMSAPWASCWTGSACRG